MTTPTSVLLVEDSDADYEATVRALKKSGAAPVVYRCADGDDALAFLRRLRDRDPNAVMPSVILLDLNLPGTDGREVLEQIKRDESLKHIPVVVLSTSAASSDLMFCYRRGASSYIVKPVDLAKFAAAVQTFCNYWFEAVQLPPPEDSAASSAS